jgi:hypothetical protein
MGSDRRVGGRPMSGLRKTFVAADENMHPVDPDDWTWSESWFFSWIGLDAGPAGFARVGVLPNQQRAMLWAFVHVDGSWLGIEETRLAFDDLDLSDGVAYDKWGLRFAWRPDPPLGGARFTFERDCLVRTGPRAGAHLPLSIDLVCGATGDCVATSGGDDDRTSPYEAMRLEQPLDATGDVVFDGKSYAVRAGAHRDRSWGPREWRQTFSLGDLQAPGRQLYFVGRTFPGLGMGFLREAGKPLRHLVITDGEIDFDDDGRTIGSARLHFDGGTDGGSLDVTFAPITPSVAFDMAHTCRVPEDWLYWRTLIEARVSGPDEVCRGWFETSRYGCGPTEERATGAPT